MVEKFATDGSDVSKRRPPGSGNNRVRNEVGTTKSVNAGSIPNSTVKYLTNNNNLMIPHHA